MATKQDYMGVTNRTTISIGIPTRLSAPQKVFEMHDLGLNCPGTRTRPGSNFGDWRGQVGCGGSGIPFQQRPGPIGGDGPVVDVVVRGDGFATQNGEA
jgi:hypothetical protein